SNWIEGVFPSDNAIAQVQPRNLPPPAVETTTIPAVMVPFFLAILDRRSDAFRLPGSNRAAAEYGRPGNGICRCWAKKSRSGRYVPGPDQARLFRGPFGQLRSSTRHNRLFRPRLATGEKPG